MSGAKQKLIKKPTTAGKKSQPTTQKADGEGSSESSSNEAESGDEGSEDESDAIARRKSKRVVKANKMDDHIYYQSGKRTANEAGLSTSQKASAKRHREHNSDSNNSESERVFSDDGQDEEERGLTKEQKQRQSELR